MPKVSNGSTICYLQIFHILNYAETSRDARLELAVRSLDRLLLISGLVRYHLLVAGPVHRLQTFRKDRMRVMEAGVEPVSIHAGQILDLKLDERGSELLSITKLDSECICGKLVWPKNGI